MLDRINQIWISADGNKKICIYENMSYMGNEAYAYYPLDENLKPINDCDFGFISDTHLNNEFYQFA